MLPRTLSREQVREVDRLAIEELGIPGVVLMENAGRNTAEAVLDLLGRTRQLRPEAISAVILCGGGNNGGDGYVIARHLHNHGCRVRIDALYDPARLTGDAAVHARICQRMGLELRLLLTPDELEPAAAGWASADVLVDALLGTGFRGIRGEGQVREPMASAIRRVNALAGPSVVAVDVPSGLDCQTGQPGSAAIRADLTVTFVARKTGFEAESAAAWLGEVVVADIGAPPELADRVAGA